MADDGRARVEFEGNLTRDPEVREFSSGSRVTGFAVAVTRRRFDKNTNTWSDGDTTFYNCSAWRDLGERAAEQLTKGSRVWVSGRFEVRRYQKNDGSDGQSLDVDVDRLGLVLARNGNGPRSQQRSSKPRGRTAGGRYAGAPIPESENPFSDPWA